MASMEDSLGRPVFTGEQVLGLLDKDGEDGGLDDMFFPGSDERFGMDEEEIGRHDTYENSDVLVTTSLPCTFLRKIVTLTHYSK